MINPIKHSFTRKNESGSDSARRELCTAMVRRDTTPSHNSSTSLSDLKVPVVSRTCVSTMKKPEISCVTAEREARGSGIGSMRSDWI